MSVHGMGERGGGGEKEGACEGGRGEWRGKGGGRLWLGWSAAGKGDVCSSGPGRTDIKQQVSSHILKQPCYTHKQE